MRKASTRLPEQGTQTPSPAPDLIPAEPKNQPRTHIAIGPANGGTSEATLGKSRVYLADLHIIPGNSGSPLFLAPSFTFGGIVTDSKGGIPYGLVGVVSGYMWEDDRLTLRAATDYEATVHANSGIATIVPVDQLRDLLYSPELQRERDVALEQYKRAKGIH